jgi:flagellar protein FlaG
MKVDLGDSFSNQIIDIKTAQKPVNKVADTQSQVQTQSGSLPSLSELRQIKETEGSMMPVSEKFIIEAIEKANKAIDGARTEFRFSVHEKTHLISVKVLDKDTQEVIREIPPEKVLDMVARMWELAGVIVDEKR